MFRAGDYDFIGEWYGWRLRGRLLISPDGERITRTRLEGILFHEASRKRLAHWHQLNNGQRGAVVVGSLRNPP